MGVMVEEFKSSPKREFKNTKGKKFSRSTLLAEVLAQGGTIESYTAEDGTIKMKILLKKQDLKNIMNNATGVVRDHRPNNNTTSSLSSSLSSSSIERRLYDLMKRKKANAIAKGNKSCSSSSSWRPALQSIPEAC